MLRTEKDAIIADLKDQLALDGGSVILAEFKGITVEKVNAVRRVFREAEVDYRVVKNSLLQKAVAESPLEALGPLLSGSTAIAFSKTDPVAPAKAAVQCAKEHEHFVVKGGFFDDFLDAANVEMLAKMPTKDELRSTLLATMIAAPQSLMRLLLAAPQRALMVLDARRRQLEEES